MTNSYILYCKYHKLHRSKDTVSHYNFIKQIALAWINPELFPTPKVSSAKRKSREEKTHINTRSKKRIIVEPDTFSGTSSSSKCNQVDDKTLDPVTGKLSIRLNTTVQHFPELSNAKKPRCQLHRWARGREGSVVCSNVLVCSICRVSLCINCYNIFHKEANLKARKDYISQL